MEKKKTEYVCPVHAADKTGLYDKSLQGMALFALVYQREGTQVKLSSE